MWFRKKKKMQRLNNLAIGERIWIGDDVYMIEEFNQWNDLNSDYRTEIILVKLHLSEFIKADLR